MRDKNGWPGSLRESVSESTGDRYYLCDDTLDYFDSHMVKVLRNTGQRFRVLERITDGSVDYYRAVEFRFTWDALGRRRHVSAAFTDRYRTIEHVMEAVNRGFFED